VLFVAHDIDWAIYIHVCVCVCVHNYHSFVRLCAQSKVPAAATRYDLTLSSYPSMCINRKLIYLKLNLSETTAIVNWSV
jgi:hypothetical protein